MASKLQRVNLVKNPHYQRDGLKSYGHLLRKYGITPTVEGPFRWENHPHHQGKFGHQKAIGGRTRMEHRLVFHHSEARHHKPKPKPTPTPTPTGPTTEPSSGGGGTASGTISTQPGTEPATDIQNDSEYICAVQIGTPPQQLMLDFDTGSADLWVWSTELPAATQQSGSSHTIFNPKNSSTFKTSSGSTWNISYGDGSSASGDVGTDNVTVGGLLIKNQAVELAKVLSSEFQQDTGDGLLGLAWGAINTVTPTPVQTPVENMISEGDIPANMSLFTAYLNSWRDTNDTDRGLAFYTFGYIDQDVLTTAGITEAQIHYTPIDNSQGFWQFPSTSATVNGQSIALSNNTAIADTGTTLALVSDSVCQAIYNAIPGAKLDSQQQGYVFPSSVTPEQLPVVQFDVGGQLYTLKKEDLSFADAGNGMTYGGVQSRGQQNFDILGDTFLKSIYAIFDVGNKQFGAVQRADDTGASLEPLPSSGQ